MTFTRLTRGDWVAGAAALALMLVMALDWYSTDAGEQARRDAGQVAPAGPLATEAARKLDEDAEIIANRAEKNAWQADPLADRLILVALLAAILLALAAAWLRAAGRRFDPPWTPSALATGAGVVAAALLAARIVQKPEADPGAVVKLGAPLGLVCVGALALGARWAWNAERDGTAWDGSADAAPAAADASATGDEERTTPAAPLFDHAEPEGGTATLVKPEVADDAAPAASAATDAAAESDGTEEEAWDPAWDDADPEAAAAAERERRRSERARSRTRGAGKKPRRRRF